MARTELRFGTVVSVAGRDAQVRFPGIADPVPVRCVEGVPAVGSKVGCWQTSQRLYYLAGHPPVVAGKVTQTAGIQQHVFPPPAHGMRLVSLVVSLDGGAMYWLGTNGYQQCVVGAEITDARSGEAHIVRAGVGAGNDPATTSTTVHYLAYYQ